MDGIQHGKDDPFDEDRWKEATHRSNQEEPGKGSSDLGAPRYGRMPLESHSKGLKPEEERGQTVSAARRKADDGFVDQSRPDENDRDRMSRAEPQNS